MNERRIGKHWSSFVPVVYLLRRILREAANYLSN